MNNDKRRELDKRNKLDRKMVEKKTWKEFRETGFLWAANRILHMFGWSIVVEVDKTTGEITSVYPARVKFRGFSEEMEREGFKNTSEFMFREGLKLYDEARI